VALGASLVVAGTARAGAWAPHRVIVGYRPRGSAGVRREDVAERADLAAGTRHWSHASARTHVTSRVVRLPRGESVPAAIRRLRGRAGVAYAEPDYIAHATGEFYPDDRGRANVKRGWERQQWNLLPGAGVNAPEAWANLLTDHRAGGRGVRIAVLDTGVAYRDYKRYRVSPDLREARFVDPYDFIAHNRYPLDRNGHGTWVASAIAESTNNNVGLAGLAYGATIMPLRVLGAGGTGEESTIAKAIRYAVAHHADIINLSLEFVPSQVHSARAIPQIVSAIADARRHGVMVVGAAGNDEARQLSFPARVKGVVAVGATTKDECLANYSDTGKGLALVAPGGGSDAILPHDPACHPERVLPSVYQLTLDDPPHWSKFGYPGFYIGTSMAAPEVSAAAALVIASGVIGRHPTPDQVLKRLEQTATPLPAGAAGPNRTYGYGLLNAGAATAPLAVPASR